MSGTTLGVGVAVLALVAMLAGVVAKPGTKTSRWLLLPLAVGLLVAGATGAFALTEKKPCYEVCGSMFLGFAAGMVLLMSIVLSIGARALAEARRPR
jgi:hypothetical protein